MKMCSKCNIVKEEINFSKRGDGLRSYCKSCASVIGKKHKDEKNNVLFDLNYIKDKLKSNNFKGILYSPIQTKIVLENTQYLPEAVTFHQRLFHIKHDKQTIDKCEWCTTENKKFFDYKFDYSDFCSKECRHADTVKRRKEYQYKHYEENKEMYFEKARKDYENRKEEIKEYQKQYNIDNKEQIAEVKHEWVKNNPEKVKASQDKWRKNNPEKIKEKRLKDKDYQKEYFKTYRHTQKYKDGKKRYYENNPHQALFRSILNATLKRVKQDKTDTTINMLGYSALQLKEHLESLFVEGMNWENHGNGENQWNVDHIKAVSKFDPETPMDIVNALSNLQPLWAIDNFKKGNK